MFIANFTDATDEHTIHSRVSTTRNAKPPFAKGELPNDRGQAQLCRTLNDPRRRGLTTSTNCKSATDDDDDVDSQ